jgi:hypothetical protein
MGLGLVSALACSLIGRLAHAGVEETWVASFQGLAACQSARLLGVDGEGNVLITGVSSLPCDGASCEGAYVTVKLGPGGTERWRAVFGDAARGADLPVALALDAAGNVHVTGGVILCSGDYRSCRDDPRRGGYETVKYDRDGRELWVARYGGPGTTEGLPAAIALDVAGNVYVTGDSEGAYVTVKYDRDGKELWVARYEGEPDESACCSRATDLAVDAAGSAIVTGVSQGVYATVKYDPDGNELWVARTEGKDAPVAVSVDGAGNVFVAGTRWPPVPAPGNFYDAIVVKYDASGQESWIARHDGPEMRNDFPTDLAVDARDNILVAGWSQYADHTADFLTLKYDGSGNEVWARLHDGPEHGSDFARALAVDPLGSVYVTGASVPAGGTADLATIKYDGAGNLEWVARYRGPGGSVDNPTGIALDADGGVYVSGGSRVEGGVPEIVTVRYADRQTDVERFRRGDVNGDGEVSGQVTDAVYLLNFNFSGGPEPPCLAACDANGDGQVTGMVTDAVYLLTFSFLGGPAPATPFPACGESLAAADVILGCEHPPEGCR